MKDEEKDFAWIITEDHLDDTKKDKPNNDGLTVEFKLFDDDDILYYSGWMTQDLMDDGENAFKPLDWAMAYAGCTSMQYKEPGKDWETL